MKELKGSFNILEFSNDMSQLDEQILSLYEGLMSILTKKVMLEIMKTLIITLRIFSPLRESLSIKDGYMHIIYKSEDQHKQSP